MTRAVRRACRDSAAVTSSRSNGEETGLAEARGVRKVQPNRTGALCGVQSPEEEYGGFVKDNIAAPLTGRQAPDFMLPQTGYQAFSLRDVRGRPAVLAFYPGDWDPVSRQQLSLYQEFLPEFRRFDAAIVAISVDSIWSHAAFGRALGLSFPLLSDFHPRGEVSRAYDVYQEKEGRSARALFVIDPEGDIRWSHTVPTNLNPGVQSILGALETLNDRRSLQDGKLYRSSTITD